MYQNLPLCKKHGSYTCRATLRNFVGNIPTLLNFVRKIPTHGTMCRNYAMWECIIQIQQCGNVLFLHIVPCVGIFLTKFNSVGMFPTKFCKNSQ